MLGSGLGGVRGSGLGGVRGSGLGGVRGREKVSHSMTLQFPCLEYEFQKYVEN